MKFLARLEKLRSRLAQSAERDLASARGELEILEQGLADLQRQSAHARAECLRAVLAGDGPAADLSRLEEAVADAARPRFQAYVTKKVSDCQQLEQSCLDARREHAVVEHLLQTARAKVERSADRAAQQALDETYLAERRRNQARRDSGIGSRAVATITRGHF